MTNKYVFFTLLFFIGFSFGNCSDEDDCNCSGILSYFNIEGMEVWQVDKLGTYGALQSIPEGGIVNFADYAGVDVNFVVDYVASLERKKDWSFSLIPSALACTCLPDGHEGSKTEKFQKFEVFTLHDFDDAHLAHSSINDLLSIERDFDRMLNVYLESKEDVNVEFENFVLRPIIAPVLTDSFQVRVEVELTNGETYTVESGIVRF